MNDDFECVVCGNVWHYNREGNFVTRNGIRLKVIPIHFCYRKTFENYCRRNEYNL